MGQFPEIHLLDYKLAKLDLEAATAWCLAATQYPEPDLVVTLNPEIIIQAQMQPALKTALQAASLSVADGVGVVWAARQLSGERLSRVAGVELAMNLLVQGGPELRVFFLGAKPGVAELAATTAARRFATVTAGVQHGYFKRPEELPSVLQNIRDSGANVLLAGLGEGQELFLHTYRQELGVPLMIGVGGTLDVLSGTVKRMPRWTQRLGLEWAFRVGLDPKRWHRLPRLGQFVRLVYKAKRQGS